MGISGQVAQVVQNGGFTGQLGDNAFGGAGTGSGAWGSHSAFFGSLGASYGGLTGGGIFGDGSTNTVICDGVNGLYTTGNLLSI